MSWSVARPAGFLFHQSGATSTAIDGTMTDDLPSLFPASCSADASYRTPRVVATSGRRLPLRAVPVSVAVVAAAMAVWSVHYMPLLLHVITVR